MSRQRRHLSEADGTHRRFLSAPRRAICAAEQDYDGSGRVPKGASNGGGAYRPPPSRRNMGAMTDDSSGEDRSDRKRARPKANSLAVRNGPRRQRFSTASRERGVTWAPGGSVHRHARVVAAGGHAVRLSAPEGRPTSRARFDCSVDACSRRDYSTSLRETLRLGCNVLHVVRSIRATGQQGAESSLMGSCPGCSCKGGSAGGWRRRRTSSGWWRSARRWGRCWASRSHRR